MPSADWCNSILSIADLLSEKSLTGHICCLNIWIPGLDSEELLESAECKRPGNVFSLADDNTAVFGSAIKLLGFHPEVDMKYNAGIYNKYWVDIWKDRLGMWCQVNHCIFVGYFNIQLSNWKQYGVLRVKKKV